MVARKRPARTIRTMHAGRQPDDQQRRQCIAERWHRPAVVIRVIFTDRIEKRSQPRTRPAVPVEYRVPIFRDSGDLHGFLWIGGISQAISPTLAVVKIDHVLVEKLCRIQATKPGFW